MRYHCWLIRSILATLLIFSASSAFSQTLTTGDVTGLVTDSTGAVVPNATVTLRFTDTNDTRTVATNQVGQYRFSLLAAGNYVISAQTAGLKSGSQRFNLLIGQEQAMNLV